MTADSSMQLSYDPFGRLVLTLPSGETHVGVVPIRGFPFSAPSQWISLCDDHGREVYCLPDLSELPAPVLKTLEADLARREFIPQIRRILSVSPGAEPTDWHVVTDRGETSFTLTSEDHIARLSAHSALITDAHGVRYRIMDLSSLDPHSRRILRRYL